MRVLFDLERARPVVLLGIPELMKQTEPWIAGPRKDELLGATHTDHLVVDDIRAHPDQGEIPPLLPNNFMACRKRHQMTEAFERHTVAIVHEFGDCVSQTCHFTHMAVEANRLP